MRKLAENFGYRILRPEKKLIPPMHKNGWHKRSFIFDIVQLGLKLNTKLGLNHHHHHPPPGTFQRLLGIVGG